MPRLTPSASLDAIVAIVTAHPEGLSIDDLTTQLPEFPRRTLQRYLAQLASAGRVHAVGGSSSRRYLPSRPSGDEAPVAARGAAREWRPQAGVEVEQLVRRPLYQRTPVGYRREFLDAYRPNRDYYLAAPVRAHLHDVGRSPDGARPAGTYARQVMGRLLIDLSWASSRLEGNTYSRLNTQNLIEFGRLAEGKDQIEAQMILNHKAAIEMLVDSAETISFNRYTLQNLHAALADNLLSDPRAVGRLRTIMVSIPGTTFQPTGIPQLIEESFDEMLRKAGAIQDPFEQAMFVLVHIPYLQPFEDVNKRVSRVAASIPFVRDNLAPLSFVDVPTRAYVDAILGVYELNRVELMGELFAWAYERSCERFTTIRDALPAPEALRLRYRVELAEIVRDTVKDGDPIDPARLRGRAAGVVDAANLDTVIAMAINELHLLHEGSIARFGLRLSEFREWRRIGPAAE